MKFSHRLFCFRIFSDPQISKYLIDYGHFCFTVNQTGETQVLVNCKYDVKASRVARNHMNQVREIIEAIENIKEKEIVVSLSE